MSTFADKYIWNLDISMYNMVFFKVFKSLIDIHRHCIHFFLSEMPYRLKSLVQIPAFTQLRDDVTIAQAGQDLLAVDNIGVV